MKRLFISIILLSLVDLGCFSTSAWAQTFNKSITASSGVPHSAGTHGLRATAPFSLKITKKPSHGTATIQRISSAVSRVVYQSKKGYVGKDEFAYVRVGSDVAAGTYVIAVTVR